jgi:hypothetical protein
MSSVQCGARLAVGVSDRHHRLARLHCPYSCTVAAASRRGPLIAGFSYPLAQVRNGSWCLPPPPAVPLSLFYPALAADIGIRGGADCGGAEGGLCTGSRPSSTNVVSNEQACLSNLSHPEPTSRRASVADVVGVLGMCDAAVAGPVAAVAAGLGLPARPPRGAQPSAARRSPRPRPRRTGRSGVGGSQVFPRWRYPECCSDRWGRQAGRLGTLFCARGRCRPLKPES